MIQITQFTVHVGGITYADKPESLINRDAIHEAIEIKCFYEGAATLLIEDQAVSVKAGDVVVINPYEFHATADTGDRRGKYHLFMLPLDYFSGEPALDLHSLFFVEGKKFRNLFSDCPQMHELLMRAAEETDRKQEASDLMIKSLMMGFFALLLRSGVEETAYSTPSESALRLYMVIEPALRCIKNEYSRALTLDELAKKCNVSKYHFCRIFRTVTQKSAVEYLRDFRLRVANALLSNTDNSVAQIAACCGFENPNYFSRCYKKRYGNVPSRRRTTGEKTI